MLSSASWQLWKWVETYYLTWYSVGSPMHQIILARISRNEAIAKSNPFR
jgi:hypothetical protein